MWRHARRAVSDEWQGLRGLRGQQGRRSDVLPTHCGLDYTVDFDGSVWALDDPAWAGSSGIGSRIGFNQQEGTMTLIDADRALFSFDSGVVRGEIKFTRTQGARMPNVSASPQAG